MLSGVGLGASGIDVVGNVFSEVGGHGIAVGGVRQDAHHPSDPRMINKDIRIENNTINRVAVEYKDNSGILGTYATNVQIVHNEVANVAYDGIDTGYGWGINDAGGGSLYNLSASPGTVVERNYLFNVSGVGLDLDEGTRYTTYRQNVLQGTNPWIFTNAYSDGNNTSDNMIRENWFNSGGAQIPNAEERNNQLIDNVSVAGTSWPQGALEVMCEAGVAPQCRTTLNANLFELAQCPVVAPVSDGYQTTAASAGDSYFGQRGTAFGVAAAGADVWGAGGQRDDEFGALYRTGSFSAGSEVPLPVRSERLVRAAGADALAPDVPERRLGARRAVDRQCRRSRQFRQGHLVLHHALSCFLSRMSGQPLTAPRLRPDCQKRCSEMNTTISGMIVSSDDVRTRFCSSSPLPAVEASLFHWLMPTVSGYQSGSLSMIRGKK